MVTYNDDMQDHADFLEKQILKLMVKATENAAVIIRRNYRKSSQYQDKLSHLDIVTETDFASQEVIKQTLTQGMIELGINETEVGFVEEESDVDRVRKHCFIIDPLDGTTNFSSGIPYFCISIGYAVDQKIQVGVVFDPISETFYWGEVDKGSFVKSALNGEKRLKLLNKPIKSWIVGAHLNGLDVFRDQLNYYQRIYPQVRALRNTGSLTLDLCLMADNVYDVVFNQGCYIWDLAAASVILNEAGATIYDIRGNDLEFNWRKTKTKLQIIACKPENKQIILSF